MDSEDERDDEVIEIKRAMREATARKKSLDAKLRIRWEKDNLEKSEYEIAFKKSREDVEACKKKIAELDYDLREARYDIAQWGMKYGKLKDEKELQASVMKSQLLEASLQQGTMAKEAADKGYKLQIETDKALNLLEKVLHQPQTAGERTQRHLLEKIFEGLRKLKTLAGPSGDNNDNDNEAASSLMFHPKRTTSSSSSADSAVDAVMLDLCHSLEEENMKLQEQVASLQGVLEEVQREATASQLIPSYRLAIVRSRTYAANLLEQLHKEQETSTMLRDQLQETYADLRQVVEDKRRLYKAVDKGILRKEIDDEEEAGKEEEDQVGEDRGGRGYSRRDGRAAVGIIVDRAAAGNRRRRGGGGAEERSRSHSSRRRPSPPIHREDTSPGHRADIETKMASELYLLDNQIEQLKEKLGKAALLQSQRILQEVMAKQQLSQQQQQQQQQLSSSAVEEEEEGQRGKRKKKGKGGQQRDEKDEYE